MARIALPTVILLACGSPALFGQPATRALDATGSTAPAPTGDLPREGCVTPECHPGVKGKAFTHGPVQVNGCDACHTLTDPTTHRFGDARDRHDLCSLCHAPDVSMGEFVHEPFAEGACLDCHDPHTSVAPAMLRGERYADTCYACHEDMAGGHDRVHGPISVGACGACHAPHGSVRPKLLNAEGKDLCLNCHLLTEVELETMPVVHAPAHGDCQVCHDPHATDEVAILTADPATLCTECHQDIANTINTASTKHEAVTTSRACLNCHTAHASEFGALLREGSRELCFECHNEAIKLPSGETLINMKELIEQGSSLHGAISQQSCVECHQIHGGGHRRLLFNEYPSDLYYPFDESTYALCFACHDRDLVLLPETDAATGFRNGSANLHFVHVNKEEKGRSCSLCHDAHASSREQHIRDEVPFGPGGWKLPIRYEALPDGGRCAAGCHRAYEYDRVNPEHYPEFEPTNDWAGEDLVPGTRADPPEGPGERRR
jgi:predicted CXXCH cytochrome family protein